MTAQCLLAIAAIGGVAYLGVTYVRAARRRARPHLPSTMAEVDWTSPNSSEFCLACHRPVGPAVAGLDVEHGHPQNVPLSPEQVRAARDMGGIIGPGNTLICMTCHKLGPRAYQPFMLADTLTDGKFCGHCHPGHYARGTPHDLRKTRPDARNRLGQTAAEGGPCSACHLAHRYARDFRSSKLDPDGRCITCHRAGGIAAQHARTAMDHPESRCEECHDPHDPSYGDFLKEPIAELCTRCHEGFAAGPAAGMHSVGQMDTPVPQELIDAGAWVQADLKQLTCVICHSPHAGSSDGLLVMNPDTNDLCLTCHPDLRGPTAREGMSPRHGQAPRLDQARLAVVAHWGTRVGPNDELLCITCHKVHDSHTTVDLLAFPPRYGETCGACHPHHDSVMGSSHDLRTNFPDLTNKVGLTPRKNGACSACHLAHGVARETSPAPGDPTGQCITCHQPGRCGEKQLAGGTLHPKTECTDCHDPHERRFGNYLAQPDAELCLRCHEQQATICDGPHDPSRDPGIWPADRRRPNSLCLACHVAHGGDRPDLFRTGAAGPVGMHDDVCLSCHPGAAWNADSDIAAIHPHDIPPDQTKVPLQLVPKDSAGNLRMGCKTCHDPHGGAEPVHLARVSPGEPTEDLCFHCHKDKVYVKYTGHSSASLARFGFDVDSCKPCHAMHANPADTWGQMLSPRFLEQACRSVPPDLKQPCVPCLACHHPNGPAPVRKIATHPKADMWNIVRPGEPGYLPLFNAAGQVDTRGQVTCRTCHLSHGRLDLLKEVAQEKTLSHAEQMAIRTQLRPFVAPNLCTECHGAEARARFLFFHDPQRRRFPRHDPSEERMHTPPPPGA